MKICMLVTDSVKKDPRVQREANTASSAGLDVTVLGCNDQNYDEEFITSQPYSIWIYRLDMKYRGHLKSNVKKFLRMWLPIYNLYKKCIELKPDVIHANDFDTLPAAYFAARKLKCAVVYDSHEIYSGMPQLVNKPVIRNIIKAIEGFIIKRVDAVTSVSHAAAKVLASMYKIKEPTVVTNCSFYNDGQNFSKKNESFEVVYHGMINLFRGYEELAEAAKYINDDVKIVIRGYGSIKGKIEEYVKAEGLLGKVEFAEPVEIKDLIPEAAKSMVGAVLTVPVSDNFKYTVSNKIFEYVQARIPVILSDVPEHRYINDLYHIGIVIDDVTPEKIAEAINKFYLDKEFYERCRQNVEKAAKVLCWENEGSKLVEIYKNVSKAREG